MRPDEVAPPGPSRRALLLGGAAAGLALCQPGAAWAAVEALGMRFGSHQGFTRFVVELGAGVDFSLFTLADPYRVVVDLPEVDFAPLDPHTQARGLVEQVRYGLFNPGQSRMVLDLKEPAEVLKVFTLSPRDGHPWRLVIDLAATGRNAFLAGAGPGKRVGAYSAPKPEPLLEGTPDPRQRGAGGKPIIALDPGHGGVDPGAIGVSGIHEKEITLAAARQLRQLLEATGRYKVVLTRDRDMSVRLRQRIAIARHAGADLFISLHADSIKNTGVRGLSVYTLSEDASDAEAAALAEAENKADIISGMDFSHESPEVTDILIDLAQRETMNLSARLAAKLVDSLSRDFQLLRRTHRFAGFAVLKSPDVPSVLLEMGYLSNREEERKLRTAAYRKRLMEAVVATVDRYFTQDQKAFRP
ncbi:N-acetylmuramoyl-L-alanine amidase [Roseospirillum parvum]|uniref:N-acetylmuramoyl-L-alanine amidase n=1 Tax=Roseospirillum parvum TaxID=83401 RepID=UPI001FDF00F0|nr:N-acetylmuramoyl-L-alanine amidase [Roseospirillum parvum]